MNIRIIYMIFRLWLQQRLRKDEAKHLRDDLNLRNPHKQHRIVGKYILFLHYIREMKIFLRVPEDPWIFRFIIITKKRIHGSFSQSKLKLLPVLQ